MYKSPIDIIHDDFAKKVMKRHDESICMAVAKVGINVDKEELIRVLQYDRNQYDKGYADGRSDAVAHGMWNKYHDYFTKRHIGWICNHCSAVSSSSSKSMSAPQCGQNVVSPLLKSYDTAEQ